MLSVVALSVNTEYTAVREDKKYRKQTRCLPSGYTNVLKITNLTKNTVLAQRCELANTPFKRMKGLLGRRRLEDGEGLIIQPCSSVHTFFMRFPIDVIFLDASNKIIGLYKEFPPFRLSRIFFAAQKAIELPAGVLGQTKTQEGEFLNIEKN